MMRSLWLALLLIITPAFAEAAAAPIAVGSINSLTPDSSGAVTMTVAPIQTQIATASVGGGLLSAATCTSGTATITGATTGMVAIASPVTYPGDGIQWQAYVSSANTVTVKVCALALLTPTTSLYNVRVIQ